MRTTRKGDLEGRWRDPVRERRAANVVPEPDHAGDSGPTVLTKPIRQSSPLVSW